MVNTEKLFQTYEQAKNKDGGDAGSSSPDKTATLDENFARTSETSTFTTQGLFFAIFFVLCFTAYGSILLFVKFVIALLIVFGFIWLCKRVKYIAVGLNDDNNKQQSSIYIASATTAVHDRKHPIFV